MRMRISTTTRTTNTTTTTTTTTTCTAAPVAAAANSAAASAAALPLPLIPDTRKNTRNTRRELNYYNNNNPYIYRHSIFIKSRTKQVIRETANRNKY